MTDIVRCSPIGGNETALSQKLQSQRSRLFGRVARRAVQAKDVDITAVEPVSDRVLQIGNFIASHCDLSRFGRLELNATQPATDQIYSAETLREVMHRDRSEIVPELQPQPRVKLGLFGIDHGSDPVTRNSFMCQFNIFAISADQRLIQAVPYDLDELLYHYQQEAMEVTVAELFKDTADTAALEQLAAYNLATVDTDGNFSPIRDFNMRAFDVDLVPVLATIGDPRVNHDIELMTLKDGYILEA